MCSRLWPFLLVVPFTVFAQTTTGPAVALTVGGKDAGFANATQCADSEAVAYTARVTSTPCNDLQVWVTAGTCGNRPDAGDLTIGTVAAASVIGQPTGTFPFTVLQLPLLDAGCPLPLQIDYHLCGSFQYPTSNGLTVSCTTDGPYSGLANAATFRYDAVPPAPPSIVSVNPLENGLALEIDPTSDTTSIDVEVMATADDAGADAGAGTWVPVGNYPAGSTVNVSHLENLVTYQVRVQGEDAAGNVSDYSELASGMPQPLTGFWDRYQAANGGDRGCAQGGTGPLWLIGALPALWALRRRWR